MSLCLSSKVKSLLFLMLCFSFSATSFAQSPRTIPIGIFDLSSSLLLEYTDDENLYRSASNPVSATFATITPSFELSFDNGVSGFNLLYSLESAAFSERDSENYTDQSLDVSIGTIFSGINRIEASYILQDDHDRRDSDAPSGGPVDLISDLGNLDEFEDVEYGVSYTLGNEDSLMTLQIALSEFEREYSTNLINTAEFNREESSLAAVVGWNVSQDLMINMSYINTDITYINNFIRDGDEQIYSLGLIWAPVEFLQLESAVGIIERSTLVTGEEISNNYWDVNLTWNVYSYSALSLLTSSFFEEDTTNDGAYTLRQEVGFSWLHEWTDTLETELSYVDGTLEYIGGNRVDNSERTFFRISYDFRQWLNAGFFFENAVRSTNTDVITVASDDYDQQVFGVSLLFQL